MHEEKLKVISCQGFCFKYYYIVGMLLSLLISIGCDRTPVHRNCDEEPAWSPDGRYIAFYRDPNRYPPVPYGEEDSSGIWILNLDTMEANFLVKGWSPDWLPDGEWIAYGYNRDIYMINVGTKGIRQLTTWGSCFSPDWSPNGQLLVFDCSIDNLDSNGIWIMELGTNSAIKHIGLGREPSWGPDCRKIVYAGRSAFPSLHEFDVWVTDTSGIDTLRLTSDGGRSPDAKKIVFSQRDEEAAATSLWIRLYIYV